MKHVIADSSSCIGAGLCATTAPTVFDLGDDGFVQVIAPSGQVPDEQVGQVDHAISVCPAQALRWE